MWGIHSFLKSNQTEMNWILQMETKQMDEAEAAISSDSMCKRYKCSSCPYISDSKSQYIYHKQFHRPRGAPYKCPKCSYNVSRKHLLNQHLKVHGLPPVKGEGILSPANSDQYGSDSDHGNSEFVWCYPFHYNKRSV